MAPKVNKVSTTHKAVVSKQAYNVAKSTISTDFTGTLPGIDTTNLETGKSVSFQNILGTSMDGDFDPTATGKSTKQLEEEIMGDTKSRSNQKSHAMEKNLHQMINVLNSRLKTLGEVAKIRMKLCEDDVNKDSQNTSKQAPRIGDEFDESIPKSLKDMKISNPSASSVFGPSHQKDNLVSADNVFIDPYHLVLRTKGSTEAAKKLESNLEQSFGNLNIREMKSKKSKTMSQSDKSKRTEQLKNDKKRENRQRIEKKLQVAMESFVTRSVMDGDLTFELPDHLSEEPEWPVAVKWCKDDPRSLKAENSDGEFNPDLLLRYSMERITLPSGRGLFAWLLKQAVLQRYFVSLFWMIKVKFFESDNCEEREAFLLRLLSVDYRQIVELMASRAHAEHEKDFVYKYLPFLLTNAVFFGFYYVFPGSRHIYTKGFKKTIYMQVIQIMHGIQVCPVTVKVSWAKLFPEDNHDDNEDNEDGGELFPVQIAFKTPKIKQMLPAIPHKGALNSDGEEEEDDGFDSPGKTPSPGRTKRGVLGDGEDHNSFRSASAGAMDDGGGGMSPDPNKPKSAPQRGAGGGSGGNSLTRSYESTNSQSNSYADSFRQQIQHKSILELRADELLEDHRIHKPFLRTYLQPPPEKPASLRGAMLKRQNNVQKINAQEVSPAMALFLASRSNSQGLFEHHFSQTIRRTVPVQWCAAGGSDTHRKRHIPYELHEEISGKLQHSKQDYHDVTVQYHRKKMNTLKSLDKSLTKVLSSGTTNISRMSLDLIRRQRSLRGGNEPSDAPTGIEDIDMAEMAQLAMYDDEEIDRFLADL